MASGVSITPHFFRLESPRIRARVRVRFWFRARARVKARAEAIYLVLGFRWINSHYMRVDTLTASLHPCPEVPSELWP